MEGRKRDGRRETSKVGFLHDWTSIRFRRKVLLCLPDWSWMGQGEADLAGLLHVRNFDSLVRMID